MATQATRNAAKGIGDMVSMDIPSLRMSLAVTADHHQPSPATLSRTAGNQISVRDRPRTSVLPNSSSLLLAHRKAVHRYFLPLSPAASVDNAATNASCGTSTRPMVFIRFLPSFCFSRSLRLRVMSPP